MGADGSRSPDRKYEYIDGIAYMMSSGSVAHDRIAYNARLALDGYLRSHACHLAVVFPDTGTVIGAGGIDIRSQSFRQGEISYMLNPTYWGRGFATEIASTLLSLLLSFGFTSLHLHRIAATYDPRNLASERVLQKVGMHYEGRMRENMLLRDGWRDSALYSILEQEW